MTTLTPSADPLDRPAQDEAYSVVTVLLLIAGGFVLPVVGWLAGVVMLWAGPRWTAGDKWLGTLVWPVVAAVPVLAFLGAAALTQGDRPVMVGVAAVVGLVVAVALLPWTFVRLLRAARR